MIKRLQLLTLSLFCTFLLYSNKQAEFLIEQLISDCNIKIRCGRAKLNYKKMHAKKKKLYITKEYKDKIKSAQAGYIAAGGCAVIFLGAATAFALNINNIEELNKVTGLASFIGLTLFSVPAAYNKYKEYQGLIKQKSLELKLVDQRITYYKSKIDMVEKQLKILLGKNVTDQK